MSFSRSNFGGLTNFVDNLYNQQEQHPDPYNTFLAQMELVGDGIIYNLDPFERDKFLSYYHKDISFNLYNEDEFQEGDLVEEKISAHNAGISESMHHLIEDITVPDVSITGESKSLLHGNYQTLTTYPLIIGGHFDIKFLNLAPNPIIETIMYPWMETCTVGYKDEPQESDLNYPKADLTIVFPHLYKFRQLTMHQPYYKYFNIRPIQIEMYNPSNKPNDKMYRKVTFAFDYFAVLT